MVPRRLALVRSNKEDLPIGHRTGPVHPFDSPENKRKWKWEKLPKYHRLQQAISKKNTKIGLTGREEKSHENYANDCNFIIRYNSSCTKNNFCYRMKNTKYLRTNQKIQVIAPDGIIVNTKRKCSGFRFINKRKTWINIWLSPENLIQLRAVRLQ